MSSTSQRVLSARSQRPYPCAVVFGHPSVHVHKSVYISVLFSGFIPSFVGPTTSLHASLSMVNFIHSQESYSIFRYFPNSVIIKSLFRSPVVVSFPILIYPLLSKHVRPCLSLGCSEILLIRFVKYRPRLCICSPFVQCSPLCSFQDQIYIHDTLYFSIEHRLSRMLTFRIRAGFRLGRSRRLPWVSQFYNNI